MAINKSLINKMRMLATVQTPDEQWVTAVSQLTSMDIPTLTVEYWNSHLKPEIYGTVEKEIINDVIGMKWNRVDKTAIPIVLTDAVPDYINLARLLLFAGISGYLKLSGELDYVEINKTPYWQKTIVYLNNNKQENVIAADALLGYVEYPCRNKSGKIQFDNKGMKRTMVHGDVRIELQKTNQGFF